MDLLTDEQWEELLTSARVDALHLETRDVYGVADEQEMFRRWRDGETIPEVDEVAWWRDWTDMVASITASGVAMRRARVVSEPVTDYIRYEWRGSRFSAAAGEDIRWLPRRHASRLALPGNDFWLVDRATVVFNHFNGDGAMIGNETVDDPDVARLCRQAFEAVWRLAIPHDEYTPA